MSFPTIMLRPPQPCAFRSTMQVVLAVHVVKCRARVVSVWSRFGGLASGARPVRCKRGELIAAWLARRSGTRPTLEGGTQPAAERRRRAWDKRRPGVRPDDLVAAHAVDVAAIGHPHDDSSAWPQSVDIPEGAVRQSQGRSDAVAEESDGAAHPRSVRARQMAYATIQHRLPVPRAGSCRMGARIPIAGMATVPYAAPVGGGVTLIGSGAGVGGDREGHPHRKLSQHGLQRERQVAAVAREGAGDGRIDVRARGRHPASRLVGIRVRIGVRVGVGVRVGSVGRGSHRSARCWTGRSRRCSPSRPGRAQGNPRL